jgi:hypothetical protein
MKINKIILRFIIFITRVKHIGKRHYHQRISNPTYAVINKKGKKIYCNKCDNIAVGVDSDIIMKFFRYRIPLCEKHWMEMNKNKKGEKNES